MDASFLVHSQEDGEVVVPFSFVGANQKDGRNFPDPQGAAHHQPNIHYYPEEEGSQSDDDAQTVKVLVRVNSLHENEGSFQVFLVAYQKHHKGGFHYL